MSVGAPEWRSVVDIGSVSASILLTDGSQRIRRSVDTHLGAGSITASGETGQTGIDQEALDHLRTVLDDYRRQAAEVGAPIRAIGTAAARRATNRTELERVVADALGVALDVVEPAEESELAFIGACSGLQLGQVAPAGEVSPGDTNPASGAVVTIDLGGGSTEFAAGPAGGRPETWSLPMGGLLVTRSYLRSDPPRPEELSAALSVVELHLDDLRREAPSIAETIAQPDTAVLGLGGVVTIAAVEIGLLDDDPLNGDGDGPLHGFRLDRSAVEDVFRTLATEPSADRAHNPGLPPTRVDDIVGGCAVLVEIMRQLDLDAVTVSQRGTADGALRPASVERD